MSWPPIETRISFAEIAENARTPRIFLDFLGTHGAEILPTELGVAAGFITRR